MSQAYHGFQHGLLRKQSRGSPMPLRFFFVSYCIFYLSTSMPTTGWHKHSASVIYSYEPCRLTAPSTLLVPQFQSGFRYTSPNAPTSSLFTVRFEIGSQPDLVDHDDSLFTALPNWFCLEPLHIPTTSSLRILHCLSASAAIHTSGNPRLNLSYTRLAAEFVWYHILL